jgi:hypothetical protein
MGRYMRIAARLAMHAPQPESHASGSGSAFPQFNKHLLSFHGCDVAVLAISEDGFEAEINGLVPVDSVVRLRLPGAGMLIAKVTEAQPGWVRARFVNAVSPARLRLTLGIGQAPPGRAFA